MSKYLYLLNIDFYHTSQILFTYMGKDVFKWSFVVKGGGIQNVCKRGYNSISASNNQTED